MNLQERLIRVLSPMALAVRDKVVLAGVVLTTSSALTLIGFWILEATSGHPAHPYVGIVIFMILPGVFVAGLLLIPAGLLLRRWRARRGVPVVPLPVDKELLKNAAILVAGLTVVNVAMMAVATYKGVEYMDSTAFCGLACHQVMSPEYTAYVNSPHSRVACTQCHIGPGAGWFVKSKLSGARQVVAVTLGTFSRPIPSPVHHLRPARETCEACHWPQKFHGDRLVVRSKYGEDEANTATSSVLLMRIGGSQGSGRVGIHGRHFDGESRVRYQTTDDRRQVIPRVVYVGDDGKEIEYVVDGAPPATAGEWREMDCIDCHNRPTHAFDMPESALNRAMQAGRIATDLPFLKREATAALQAEYADRDTAGREIVGRLTGFYEKNYPDLARTRAAAVKKAAESVRDVWMRNVFPDMKLGWGSHPNNIGHEDFPGCFRCHDEQHKAKDGRTISQDCNACHGVLAMEESDPKILADLGLK